MTDMLTTAQVWCGDAGCLAGAEYRRDLPRLAYQEEALWCGRCWSHTTEFERFHLLYDPRLRRFIGSRVRDFAGPQTLLVTGEINEEAMLQIWRSWESLKLPENAMFTIARRAIYRWIREYVSEPAELLEEGADPAGGDEFEKIEDQDALERGLAQLPEKTRQYIEEQLDGQSAAAVARSHGVTPSTVKNLTQRALPGLRPVVAALLLVVPLLPHSAAILVYSIAVVLEAIARRGGGKS